MRLWHFKLLPLLPRLQLLGQHRECCALRGNGWGRKHATVDYVFKHSPYILWHYHLKVIKEMKKRGYNIDEKWHDPLYRGKSCQKHTLKDLPKKTLYDYPEHNHDYLNECIHNLTQKGIIIKLIFIHANQSYVSI